MKENEDSLQQELNKTVSQPVFSNVLKEDDQDLSQMAINQSRYEAIETGEMIRDRSYEVGGKKKTGTRKASKEMAAIETELEGLSAILEDMPFDQYDEDFMRSGCKTLTDRLRHLLEKCEDYLVEKNPHSAEGKVRYNLVKQIADRVSTDITELDEKIEAFLLLSEEERDRIVSWAEFLNWKRTLEFTDHMDGVTIQKTGGNTSDVIVIEKDGKKLFFKKEENQKAADFSKILQEKANEVIDRTPDDAAEPAKDISYQMMLIRGLYAETYNSVVLQKGMVKAFSDVTRKGDGFGELKDFCKKIGFKRFDRVGSVLAFVEAIEDKAERQKAQKALGDIFFELKKAAVLADVGANTGKIGAGEELTKRNVAASRMAQLLGIPDIIPKSEMATVSVNGEKSYGVVMEEAKGTETFSLYNGRIDREYRGKELVMAPEAVKDHFDMQIFDDICGQVDRHAANRMVVMEKRDFNGREVYVINKAKGIDSDFAFGDIRYADIKERNRGRLERVESNTGLLIPAMSKELADRILELSPEIINYEMTGLLNRTERAALCDRLVGIQQAILKQKAYEDDHPEEPSKFVEQGNWQETANRLYNKAAGDENTRNLLDNCTYVRSSFLLGTKIA